MAEPGTIKLTALGVLIWRDHTLLQRSYIPGEPEAWRPLGGGIELGEPARDAVRREFLEETGRRVRVMYALPVVETIREYRGDIGHEISFPFRCEWVSDDQPADLAPIPGSEADGERFEAHWAPLTAVSDGALILHPPGLDEMLRDARLLD